VAVKSGIVVFPEIVPCVRLALPLNVEPAGSAMSWSSFLIASVPPTCQFVNGMIVSAWAAGAAIAPSAARLTTNAATRYLSLAIDTSPPQSPI
jgi:hypothetical protein